MSKNFIQRPTCPLCRSAQKAILFSENLAEGKVWSFLDDYYQGRIDRNDLADARYEVARCLDCGFIWQTQILGSELMDKLYNVWISPTASLAKKTNAGDSLFSGYAREARAISSLLGKNPSETNVLDFGMGWGYWCLAAKKLGYNISGFEISKERVAFARENGIRVIENFPDIAADQFDFINAEQVFEHLPEPLETLRALMAALKKRGIIRISVPNGRGIEKKLKRPDWKPAKNAIQPLEHINCFTHWTLIKMANLAGLKMGRQSFLPGSGAKGILKKYYQRYFGTSLYFSR